MLLSSFDLVMKRNRLTGAVVGMLLFLLVTVVDAASELDPVDHPTAMASQPLSAIRVSSPIKPSISPIKPSISPIKPSISPIKPSISPIRPSVSPVRRPAVPTAQPTPEYSVCYVCGSKYRHVIKTNATVTYKGVTHHCGALENFGVRGQVHTKFCKGFTSLTPSRCGCSLPVTQSPTAPTPPSPTITTAPVAPPVKFVCYICGNSSQHVTTPSKTVPVGGLTTTCANLEIAGLQGFFNLKLCQMLATNISVPCNCAPK